MRDDVPGIYVCVRATIDWRDEAAVDAQLIPEFRPKRALWDATFSIPYHLFRQRLKELAQENLARIRDVILTDPAQVPGIPEGAIVVPVDDDDWFSPDLAAHLARAGDAGIRDAGIRDPATRDPAIRGWRWPQRVLQARLPGNPLSRLLRGRSDPLRDEHTRWFCGSNNYAVVWEGAWKEVIGSHAAASRHFAAHPDQVRRLDETLSIQNRNLSSQTVMGWKQASIPRRKLLRRYRRHRRFYERVELPPGLQWARPYVDRMAALMAELQRGPAARSASQTPGAS